MGIDKGCSYTDSMGYILCTDDEVDEASISRAARLNFEIPKTTTVSCNVLLVTVFIRIKAGPNTCRGSNICRVVQQNERYKHLGPFKCRVPKLLILINLKMVPNVKEN